MSIRSYFGERLQTAGPARRADRALKWQKQDQAAPDTELSATRTQDVERNRLEKALEIGLEETFPASDAVAVIEPKPREKQED